MLAIIEWVIWIVVGLMNLTMCINHNKCSWSSYWLVYTMMTLLFIETIFLN